MSTLTEPTAQGLRRAVEQCAEEIHNHGELLVERNLLDIEAERKLLAGTRNPQRRRRRWPRAAGALMLLVVCYAVVARAAGGVQPVGGGDETPGAADGRREGGGESESGPRRLLPPQLCGRVPGRRETGRRLRPDAAPVDSPKIDGPRGVLKTPGGQGHRPSEERSLTCGRLAHGRTRPTLCAQRSGLRLRRRRGTIHGR